MHEWGIGIVTKLDSKLASNKNIFQKGKQVATHWTFDLHHFDEEPDPDPHQSEIWIRTWIRVKVKNHIRIRNHITVITHWPPPEQSLFVHLTNTKLYWLTRLPVGTGKWLQHSANSVVHRSTLYENVFECNCDNPVHMIRNKRSYSSSYSYSPPPHNLFLAHAHKKGAGER
jgi:hypothetical protein